MIKLMILPFLVVAWFSGSAQQQNLTFHYKLIYTLAYRPDTADANWTKMDMVLLANDKVSLFESLRRYNQDSVMYNHQPEEYNKTSHEGAIALSVVNRFDYQILKDHERITTYDKPFGSRDLHGKAPVHQYVEDLAVLDWEVKEDTLTIGDYLCQKAEVAYGGRLWTAYFTSEIPLSTGPYKFGGLPGLIIQMEDNSRSWGFNLASIQKVDLDVAMNFQKWYVFSNTSKAKFFKDRKEYQDNLLFTMTSFGASFPEAAIEGYKTRLQANSNQIELYP